MIGNKICVEGKEIEDKRRGRKKYLVCQGINHDSNNNNNSKCVHKRTSDI